MKIASRILDCTVLCLMLGTPALTSRRADAEPASFARIPLGGGEQGAEGLTLVRLPAVDATALPVAGSGTQLRFVKAGNERRIVALEGKPSGPITEEMALLLQYRLTTKQESLPQLAVVAMERDGGVWYRTAEVSPPAGQIVDLRLPLSRTFTRAVFAADADESVRWDQVERVWVALLIDSPTEATLDITRVIFTDEPFRPTSPWVVKGDWQAAHDPAVKDAVAVENAGPENQPCLVYSFTMPGGRHMYAIPRAPTGVEELAGYSALRFAYRAELPEGINGLLVMLLEAGGAQYTADPPPPGSAEWTTVTIPFDRFQRGGWSKDDNDRLDLNEVRHVAIGLHGTAKPSEASGKILIGKVEFVP